LKKLSYFCQFNVELQFSLLFHFDFEIIIIIIVFTLINIFRQRNYIEIYIIKILKYASICIVKHFLKILVEFQVMNIFGKLLKL
jgi:hypothetical protein